MYNEVAPDDDLDEYTASSGGAAVRAAAVAAGGGPLHALHGHGRASQSNRGALASSSRRGAL
eukprot:scaffold64793_cov35-Phaeocystis_antarctica.AAC.1